MKPLDFVKTPKGNIALVTETNEKGKQASITFIGCENPDNEQNAWWDDSELTVIDSLPYLLSRSTCHPFGSGESDSEHFFGELK